MFQRKMHKLIEGLSDVEFVADGFVLVGFGDNEVDAHHRRGANVLAFIHRCQQSGVKFNANRMQLRIPEVPFIGHVATADGLRVDPRKVRAINEMLGPTDVAAVQRLLGLTQYLAKFLPRLSDMTKPLRELTMEDVGFQWDEPQQAAFDALKASVTNTPVLRY